MLLARQSVSKRARRSPQRMMRPEVHQLWWGPHSDFHDWLHIVLPGASIRRKRHENVMSNVIVSQMFVLAIKGGSTTNRWLTAMDTPTDTHKGPHPTPLHLCPYGLDGLAPLAVFAPAPPDTTPPLSLRLRQQICGTIFHISSSQNPPP